MLGLGANSLSSYLWSKPKSCFTLLPHAEDLSKMHWPRLTPGVDAPHLARIQGTHLPRVPQTRLETKEEMGLTVNAAQAPTGTHSLD